MRERGSRMVWRMMKAGGALSTVPREFKNPGEVLFMGGTFMDARERDGVVEAKIREGVNFHWECEKAKWEAEEEWKAWRKNELEKEKIKASGS